MPYVVPSPATDASPPPTPSGDDASDTYKLRQWIGLVGGPALLLVMLSLPAPAGLGASGWATGAVGLLMAVWWVTEALPIAATALVPLVLFPVLGVAGIGAAAAPYANPLIFLFMGGFIIALAMERWDLHRRIALSLIRRIGTRPQRVIVGFMVATAFLSMWVSNTATVMMMLPIGVSVVELVRRQVGREADGEAGGETGRNFALVLMLAIAYSGSIGGTATLVGTPTNALLAGFLNEAYGMELSFASWLMVGLPLTICALPLVYLILTRLVYPVRLKELPGGMDYVRGELAAMGPMRRPEKMVAVVFAATAALWVFRPLLSGMVPGLSDAGVAMTSAVLLFVLPVDPRRGVFVMDWETTERLPWGVLILFGGGLSLAAAINDTGLAAWIGMQMSLLSAWPVLTVVLAVILVILLLTELTSNTATAAAFLPIVSSVAIGIGQNPLLLAVPAALAASGAFMLPVATPPNAIVYGSGLLTIPQMARAGVWINALFVVLIVLLTYTLLPLVLDVAPGVVPAWAVP